MRPLLRIVLAALGSFGVGFLGARFVAAEASRVEERQPAATAFALPMATSETANNVPGTAEERIAAVVAFGDIIRSLADDHALLLALRQLEARDFPASADALLAMLKKRGASSYDLRTPLFEAWIDRWFKVDAAGALRYLETSPFLDQLTAARAGFDLLHRLAMPEGSIFKILARRQPEWTRQYLAALPPGATRDLGTYQLLQETAQRDPAEAKRFMADLGDGPNRPVALRGYVAGLAVADVRAGFAMAFGEPGGPLREGLLTTVLKGAAKRGVSMVSELLDRVDDAALRRKLAMSALDSLRVDSREDLLPWIKEESQRKAVLGGWEGEYDGWGSSVGAAVQGEGSARAADWALTLEGDTEKKMLLAIVGSWWSDAPGLRGWLAGNASAFEPATAGKLGRAVSDLLRRDFTATRAWAETLPAGPLREQARFQVALSAGTEGDLRQAAAVYESMAANDTTGALARQLATVFATKDGAAAAAWAMQRAEGPARTAAITTVAEQWSQRDPRGAAEWLWQMPPGVERDSAVREFAAKVVFADPAIAAEWVGQVADPAARGKAAEQVFWVWHWEDPIASRTWLRALPGVDETWRAEFLRKQK